MSSLYGSLAPGSERTIEMSTAFVICAQGCQSSRIARLKGGMYYLPCLNDHACSLAHKNHVARLGVIVDKIEQDNQLRKGVVSKGC